VTTEQADTGSPRRRLNVTSLSQYIKIDNCDRFLRFRLRPDEEKAMRQRWNLTIQPLTPLLKEEGARFERAVERAIAARGEPVENLAGADASATSHWLRTAQDPVILLQPPITGHMGRHEYSGVADVVRLQRDADGALHIYIADIKASRTERMEHRLQVAAYAYLLRGMAADAGAQIGSIRGGVLHMQEDGSLPVFDPDCTFDLDTYLTILHHLAIDPDCVVERVANQDFEDVPYHLGYACDGCMYNALCMVDSAERQDLSLVPCITATEKKVLRANHIHTVTELAGLLELPPQGSKRWELTPAPGHEEQVRALANEWPVGITLPLLVQRAKAAHRQMDPMVRAAPFLFDAGYGSLPDAEHAPGLVKIFFDAQHDYLQDRVYMVAARIVGPAGELDVVHCTGGPPTDASERALLVDWVQEVLTAISLVANAPAAPLHLYCYNSYDQRVLLEALKRHLDHVAALPGFFDLLTQSPALEQPVISFLAQEVEECKNLGRVCMPLHDVARAVGFDWRDDQHNYFTLFRARMFDNRRTVVRNHDGTMTFATHAVSEDHRLRFTIEAASRFNSQIPLEYAYGARDCLDVTGDEDAKLLQPFRAVTLDQLRAFARHRTHALAHIEQSFTVKARIDKPPLDLRGIDAAAPAPSLARSLQEFLFMEHHAALQQRLQIYSLPIERRIQTGEALLVRYVEHDSQRQVHRFTIEFDRIGLDPVLTMNALRLKEGDWIILNPASARLTPNQRKHGRQAIIRAIDTNMLELELLSLRGRNQHFRYYHRNDMQPEPAAFYEIDVMADDMNADKILVALRNTQHNVFYRWLGQLPPSRPVAPERQHRAAQFATLIDRLQSPRELTSPQTDVIAGRLAEPVLIVQGPPGTGKSHTVGWAVLNRILLAAAADQPLRVAVVCRTHNAVNIVLDSIASKLAELARAVAALGTLPGIVIGKIVNDRADAVPPDVGRLHLYSMSAAQIERKLYHPYLVIGGTPGGLYNLAKYRERGGKQIDWQTKSFDLVVIDEASQMGVPEGVLAGAFLREDGAVLVVGDHRQMPPIIAHNWTQEEKRSVAEIQPHLSLFDWLRARGAPCVSLDQSFRLHRTMAQFLHENIYVHDGIQFFSHRRELLPAPPAALMETEGDGFLQAVLDPNYPIVVIEHAETTSQQFNQTELDLVEPLIRACTEHMGLGGLEGIGVVVPHRAQKSLLRTHFPALAAQDAIDTVERFQGGERDVIIVSATASDPDYVLAEADFLLNLNRLNVALSRPRQKLIVVASQAVTKLLVSDLEVFENAVIWKRLYFQYAASLLWEGERNGVQVRVRGRHADSVPAPFTNGHVAPSTDANGHQPGPDGTQIKQTIQRVLPPTLVHPAPTKSAPSAPPTASDQPSTSAPPTGLTLEDLWHEAGFQPNDAQRAAITHVEGPLYLPAGPGSGKTRVLLWRTLNLLVFHGVEPHEIFLSTFTEKAAHQLREGLETLLGRVTNRTGIPYDLTQMYVGTVHSLCQRLIADRDFAPHRQRLRPPRLLDALGQYFHAYRSRTWESLWSAVGLEADRENYQALNGLFGGYSQSKHEAVNNCIQFFNRLAEEQLDPTEALAHGLADPHIRNAYAEQGIALEWVERLLQMCTQYRNSLEYSARLTCTDFSLLQEHAYEVLLEASNPGHVFRHVIVDEYQDTNPIQERIFFMLAAGHRNLCVVGDDDQALYRFRGATVENFVQFPARCMTHLGVPPRRIPLAINYRSRAGIVDFYTRFMNECDWQRADGGHYRVTDKDIRAHRRGTDAAVVASTADAPDAVSAEVARMVRHMLDTGVVENANQIAFLFPSLQYRGKMNAQVERMKNALEAEGLAVYAPRAGRFLDVDEAVDLFGVYVQIFGRPTRGPYGGGYRRFHDWLDRARDRGAQLMDADPQLKGYVRWLRGEIARAVKDHGILTDVVERHGWDVDGPYDINQMKRPLHDAPDLSDEARRNLLSVWFERLAQRREAEGNPFTLGYILQRATSIDLSVLDIFYQVCGFDHFRRMFDRAECGEDEGPICNLGLISQYLARFIDEYVLIITPDMLTGDHLFRRLFFGSYLYALYRRGEAEYEDADDPFPKGRIPFLTIHQSKGLEFPVVVLGNLRKDHRQPQPMERIVRPLVARPDGEPLDRMAEFDAMRMFYVALSRAKNLLVLAHYQGRGQRINDPFKALLVDEEIPRIPEFDLASVPVARLEEAETSQRYAFTADFQAYRRCPRQYMIFRKYGFVPSRSETMFFGSLVHRTLEDLHNRLIDARQRRDAAPVQTGSAQAESREGWNV